MLWTLVPSSRAQAMQTNWRQHSSVYMTGSDCTVVFGMTSLATNPHAGVLSNEVATSARADCLSQT